jgi:hypothetical protein
MSFVGKHVGRLKWGERRRVLKRNPAKALAVLEPGVRLYGIEELRSSPGELVLTVEYKCYLFVGGHVRDLGYVPGHELELHGKGQQVWFGKTGKESLAHQLGNLCLRLQVNPADEPDRCDGAYEGNEAVL